jgi:hypothetical protein
VLGGDLPDPPISSLPTPFLRWASETASIGTSTTASPWARSGLIQRLTTPATSPPTSATKTRAPVSPSSSSSRARTAPSSGGASPTAPASSPARAWISAASSGVASLTS